MDGIKDLKELLPQFGEIVKLELEVAKKEKEMVKRESTRTKARAKYAEKAQELAQFSQQYAEEMKNLVEKKRKNRVNLGLMDEEVKRDVGDFTYYDALAKAELAITNVHKKLTVVGKEIATGQVDLAKSKIIAGKEGLKLIKTASAFANAFKNKLTDEVIKRKKQDYTLQQQTYNKRKEHVAQLSRQLSALQFNHADATDTIIDTIHEERFTIPAQVHLADAGSFKSNIAKRIFLNQRENPPLFPERV